jgi:hypothetical protein
VASFFHIVLDTAGPADVTFDIGTGTVASRDRTAAISTSDGTTTGYQMKIWGDVDAAFDANIQPLEANAVWVAYATSKAVRLSTGNGSKTVSLKVRDDVGNETSTSDTVTLNTDVPLIDITVAPDRTRISKIATFRTVTFTFSPDVALQAYKVKVVPAESSLEDAGTQVPTTNGSTNVSGGAVSAAGTVNVSIDGRDLELASSGDGDKIVKVFGQSSANGLWSSA